MRFAFLERRSNKFSADKRSIADSDSEKQAADWGEMTRSIESLLETAREAGIQHSPDAVARVRSLFGPQGNLRSSANSAFVSGASLSNEMGRWQSPHDPRFRPYTPLSTDALRTLARTYDILSACVHHLKSEVVKVPLLIVPRDGSVDSQAEREAIAKATAFFGTRGGLGGPGVRRPAFEGQLLDDLLILGACAVHFEFETRGDWLDGKPCGCRALDAATIRPLVSASGFPLADDEACYEQWINGTVTGRYSRHELWYEGLPTLTRTDSPYHLSLVEMAAMTTYTALKSDEWNRAWLTDGNGRGKYIKLNESVTPDQAAQWLEIIDLVTSGNARERHKLGAVPGDIVGSDSRKDADFQAFEHWLATRVMSVMGVNPASIGFNGGQYEANQEAAMGATREGTVAQLLEWRSCFYNDLLERLGFPFLQVMEDTPAKPETLAAKAARQKVEIESGLKTPNEVRRENGLAPVDGGDGLLLGSNVKSLASITGEEKEGNSTARGEMTLDVETELGRWERKCLNRLARGQSVACAFDSSVLSETVAQGVLSRLAALEIPTRESVRDVFEIARYEGQPRSVGGKFSFGKKFAPDDGGANIGGASSQKTQFVEDPSEIEPYGSRFGMWRGTPEEFVTAFVDAELENAVTYDSEGNQLCHIIGMPNEVTYPPSQAYLAKDGLDIHNHPDTPPVAFSDLDFLYYDKLNVKEGRVVTKVMGRPVILRVERIGESWNLEPSFFLKSYAQVEYLITTQPPSELQSEYDKAFEDAHTNNVDEEMQKALAYRCTFQHSVEVNEFLANAIGGFKFSVEYL